MANIKDQIFEATKTRNNIQKHVFNVADYKMCKQEADIVLVALNQYIEQLEEMKVVYGDLEVKN